MSHLVYISIWSNLWNKKSNLERAVENLKSVWNISKVSSHIQTEAWGLTDQDDFLNAVCEIETSLEPEILLKKLLEIENNMWRKRGLRWWPRIIDLDIISFDKLILKSKNLTIPHKYAVDRDFVMIPLKELNNDIYDWILSL